MLATIALWAFVAAAGAIVVELVVVLLRALREAKRIQQRLGAMRVVTAEQQARAQDAVARLTAAAEAVPVLAARANVAIETIRRMTLPPSLVAAARATAVSVRLLQGAFNS